MRKVIKPAVKCKCCGGISEYETYEEFCDYCGKMIDSSTSFPLHMTVFIHGSEVSKNIFLDSWHCVLQYLLKYKKQLLKAEFISLPYPSRPYLDGKNYSDSMQNFFEIFVDGKVLS